MKPARLTPNQSSETVNSLSDAIKSWEGAVARIGGVHKIEAKDFPLLSESLQHESDPDSYLTSPVYYAFTGRKGLWMYREEGAFLLFCWHPNDLGNILVFPPRGLASSELLSRFLSQVPAPPMGMRFARLQSATGIDGLLQGAARASEQLVTLAPVIEHKMDWHYPVRILSTEQVAKMKGPGFHKIRNRVRQIERKHPDVVIEDITIDMKEALQDFIDHWIEDHSEKTEDRSSWQSLYGCLLDLWASESFALKGFVCRFDGHIRSLTLWDVSNHTEPMANRFTNLCDIHYRGLADFVMKRTAERLLADGIRHLNLGGSENASLDQFKNKFLPAESINLHSMDVLHDEDDAFEESLDFIKKSSVIKYA